MKVVITQPNFLPWIGYFAQIYSSDKFIFLDDVQYNRREWQNRNRIINRKGKISYINININKAPRETHINKIEISKNFNYKKILFLVKEYYSGTEYVDNLCKYLDKGFSQALINSEGLLSKFNIELIKYFCTLLGIEIDYQISSNINLKDFKIKSPSEKLLILCKKYSADTYLSSVGARNYMLPEIQIFKDSNIKINWQNFIHKNYLKNSKNKFISHLSIVDFLAHNNLHSLKDYLKSCHFEEN